jgi:hypothetical protein
MIRAWTSLSGAVRKQLLQIIERASAQ